jgi:hypothetical protein
MKDGTKNKNNRENIAVASGGAIRCFMRPWPHDQLVGGTPWHSALISWDLGNNH